MMVEANISSSGFLVIKAQCTFRSGRQNSDTADFGDQGV